MKRTETLMNKELDGDLSPSEAVELERAEWTNPDLRRSRKGWQRVTDALNELGPRSPKVPVDQWAAQIVQQSQPRIPWWVRMADGWADVRWRPMAVAACAVATTTFVLVSQWPVPAVPSSGLSSTARFQNPQARLQRRVQPPPAPVEIRVDDRVSDDRDDAPVSIRF